MEEFLLETKPANATGDIYVVHKTIWPCFQIDNKAKVLRNDVHDVLFRDG